MVADQLVGLMSENHLGELRKALELARSNRSPVWLAVRPVFERIAGEIGQSPEFACAFLSSQIVRELVKAGRKRVGIDSKVDTENVALLLYRTFLGTLLLWSLRVVRGVCVHTDGLTQCLAWDCPSQVEREFREKYNNSVQ